VLDAFERTLVWVTVLRITDEYPDGVITTR
jgi:hypothetical protein